MESKIRYLYLFMAGCCNLILGIVLAVIGPTLPDLQCLYKSTLSQTATLFLPLGVFQAISAVMSVILMKKYDLNLLVCLSLVAFSTAISAVAVTPSIMVGFVAMAVLGFSLDEIISIAYYALHLLFPEESYVFHILTMMMSVGTFTAPMIAEPFLGVINKTVNVNDSLPRHKLVTQRVGNMRGLLRGVAVPNRSEPGYEKDILTPANGSFFRTKLTHINVSVVKSVLQSPMSQYEDRVTQIGKFTVVDDTTSFCHQLVNSKIQYLYAVLGVLGLLLAVGYCYMFTKSRTDLRYAIDKTQKDDYAEMSTSKRAFKVIFSVMLTFLCFFAFGLVFSYGTYITTTGIHGRFHLSPQFSAVMTTAFWFCLLCSRIVAIFVSFWMRQITIMYISSLGSMAALVLLVLTENSGVLYSWVGGCLLAFFSGPAVGALCAWGRYYVTFTPFFMGMLAAMDNLGSTLLPYFAGQIISHYGIEWHINYCLGLAVFQFSLFACAHFVGYMLIKESQLKNVA